MWRWPHKQTEGVEISFMHPLLCEDISQSILGNMHEEACCCRDVPLKRRVSYFLKQYIKSDQNALKMRGSVRHIVLHSREFKFKYIDVLKIWTKEKNWIWSISFLFFFFICLTWAPGLLCNYLSLLHRRIEIRQNSCPLSRKEILTQCKLSTEKLFIDCWICKLIDVAK